MASHGPVVSGRDLFLAVCAAQELEEIAKLIVALQDRTVRYLTDQDVAERKASFNSP